MTPSVNTRRTVGMTIGVTAVGLLGLGAVGIATGAFGPFGVEPGSIEDSHAPAWSQPRSAPTSGTEPERPTERPVDAPTEPPQPAAGESADDASDETGTADESDGTAPNGAAGRARATGSQTARQPERVVYGFTLPPSDLNVDTDVAQYNDLYAAQDPALRADRCDLIGSRQQDPTQYTRGPRIAVLYQAGYLYVCQADPAKAFLWTDHAADEYGTAALGPEDQPDCQMYRSLRSVQWQVAPASIPCDDGPIELEPPYETVIDPATGFEVKVDPLEKFRQSQQVAAAARIAAEPAASASEPVGATIEAPVDESGTAAPAVEEAAPPATTDSEADASAGDAAGEAAPATAPVETAAALETAAPVEPTEPVETSEPADSPDAAPAEVETVEPGEPSAPPAAPAESAAPDPIATPAGGEGTE
ncbi:hypothetical protein ACDF64_05490 [Agromyces sp. MMS24-JH15]|uniref:hypothetical protein n=1 Tax=Agromyces sp. MMS24-JH15 TaxID=3243765 RepID=UPI0037481FA3